MMREVNRWFEENRWAGDAIVAGALLVLLGGASLGSGIHSRTAFALSVLLVLPLVARRTFPVQTLLVTVFFCLVQLLVFGSPVPGDVVVPIVVHAAAAYIDDRRWGYAALAAGLVGAGLGTLRWQVFNVRYWGWVSPGLVMTTLLAGWAIVVVAYLIGIRQRDRRQRAAEQVASLRERNLLLTAERDSRSEAAAAAERARIARELHDIVAHSLSVIVVQADGGAAAAKSKPSVAPQVLETIAATSRDALAQMRRMVSVLRSGGSGGTGDASYAPTEGPGDVDDLVRQVRATGLPIEVQTAGTPREMAPDAGLAVYRVVQESLTNVLKHAGPAASVTIFLHYGPSEALITVTDDGRGAATSFAGDSPGPTTDDGTLGRGHGMEGMRERVGLLGGSVHAGPRSGGGFEVSATIPYGKIDSSRLTDSTGLTDSSRLTDSTGLTDSTEAS